MASILSSIKVRQSKATEKLEEVVKHFLDCCATHPNAGMKFIASNLMASLRSDVPYLCEPNSKSRTEGHFYLSKYKDIILNNRTVMTLSNIIKQVLSSASEAQTAAIFYKCKTALLHRVSFEEISHPRPKTAVTTDIITAFGLKSNDPQSSQIKQHYIQIVKIQESSEPN